MGASAFQMYRRARVEQAKAESDTLPTNEHQEVEAPDPPIEKVKDPRSIRYEIPKLDLLPGEPNWEEMTLIEMNTYANKAGWLHDEIMKKRTTKADGVVFMHNKWLWKHGGDAK